MISIGTPLWEDPRQRAVAYKDFFTGPTAEKILEDLKRTLFYYRSSFDPNPHIAAFNEGQRAVIVAITNTIASAAFPPVQGEEEDQQDA